jgi:uncharacterized protein YecT (DUF1311 family)
MNRRDFLLLRGPRDTRIVTVSCEQLYMRFVDAELNESVPALFDDLERQLQSASIVRLTGTAWLARPDLKRRLDAVLHAFRSRGGVVEGAR